jgi:hypothetical protein
MRRCSLVFFLILTLCCSVDLAGNDLRIFKQIDRGDSSFYMELLMQNPTKAKIEEAVASFLKRYGKRRRLQIDIFDDLEALQKRGDQNYPTRLVNKHWLVSITDKAGL